MTSEESFRFETIIQRCSDLESMRQIAKKVCMESGRFLISLLYGCKTHFLLFSWLTEVCYSFPYVFLRVDWFLQCFSTVFDNVRTSEDSFTIDGKCYSILPLICILLENICIAYTRMQSERASRKEMLLFVSSFSFHGTKGKRRGRK